MRLPTFSILAGFITLCASAQADFTISGSGSVFATGSTVKLYRQDLDARSQREELSTQVQSDNSFEIEVTGDPGYFTLAISGWGKIPLAAADGQQVEISILSKEASDFTVAGSPDTKVLLDYEAYRKDSLYRLVYPPRAALNKATAMRMSPDKMAPLAQAEVDGYIAHKRELNDFTAEKAGTSIALYATSLRWDDSHRIEEIERQVASFAEKHPDLAITKSMQERLRKFKLTAIGAKAAPLAGQDLDETDRSLDDFKGQVVLVDFWASWCGPCRVENRHFPKVLEKYSKNGFNILGVNMDSNRTIWSRTSQQDGVIWPQISDLQALNSPMAKAYNVSALPMSFLLDGDGRIIAKNLRGEALDKKLAELF
ncbi:redoxin domain-containing protein [Opitutia bacterium ISCC 51]|nr:redoxin domain-containing protein [Opitutae bacterium ISCC 51]QXD27279.1 redoxin domain-containing protein [Opitutae bacterium ISCC 52]